MDHGPKARSAFRALKGGDVRKRVMIECRKAHIDVADKAEGFTAPELLRAADRALTAKDYPAAMELARAANKIEQTSLAVLMMALVSCADGDIEAAASKRRHLKRAHKATLADRCPAAGTD